MKKKINFKPASEVRTTIEEKIDQWVRGDTIESKEETVKDIAQEETFEKEQGTPNVEKIDSEKKDELYRLSLDIPKYLHRRIKKTCVAEGITMKEKITGLFLREFPEK